MTTPYFYTSKFWSKSWHPQSNIFRRNMALSLKKAKITSQRTVKWLPLTQGNFVQLLARLPLVLRLAVKAFNTNVRFPLFIRIRSHTCGSIELNYKIKACIDQRLKWYNQPIEIETARIVDSSYTDLSQIRYHEIEPGTTTMTWQELIQFFWSKLTLGWGMQDDGVYNNGEPSYGDLFLDILPYQGLHESESEEEKVVYYDGNRVCFVADPELSIENSLVTSLERIFTDAFCGNEAVLRPDCPFLSYRPEWCFAID